MSRYLISPCLFLFLIGSGLTLLSQPSVITPPSVLTPVEPIVVTPSSGNETTTVPPTLYGISGGGAAELGQEIILRVSFAGTGSDQSYQWRKNSTDISGATAASYTLPAAVASDAATYTVAVSNAIGTSVASTSVTVKALAAPVVTNSPFGQTVSVGQAVSFSFAATGSYPRTHRWLKNGMAITGATGETYEITNTVTDDAGSYSVVVSNSQGSSTSASASLTVNAATPLVLNGVWVSPSDGRGVQGGSVTLGVGLISGSGPASYQWIKNGVPVVGATGTSLSLSPLVLSDAGKYSIIVSNILGSVTSSEVTVAVDTARPPAIVNPPQPVTVTEGQVISLFGSMFSNAPITYQWHKNGIAISGATNTTYRIERSARTDAGSYTLVATTIAGSVTSNPVLVTVNAAVAPSITTQPASLTVDFNSNPIFSVQAAGSSPFTYSWRKDGVVVSAGNGSSSLFFSGGVTPANNGVYTVLVTNMAGSITSNGATLTVRAPVAPVIATQPISIEVAIGLSAAFNVSYSSVGTGPLTVQWRKNGVPIANASSSYLTLSNVKETDGGDYTVVLSGPGGSATSAVAKLTVLPPAPPSVNYWPADTYAILGSSATLGSVSTSGSGPFTYKWFKDGVAILGAESASLNIARVELSDFGSYMLVIGNDAGVIASPDFQLRQSGPGLGTPTAPPPWLSAVQYGSVVYFLAASPNRIERYDLAAEKWLPTTALTDANAPTAFLPTTEGVYIAYGRTLVRRALDLSGETALTNLGSSVTQLFVLGDFLYYNGTASGGLSSGYVRRSIPSSGSGPGLSYSAVAVSQRLGRVFGGNDSAFDPIDGFSVGTDGKFTGITAGANYYYDLPGGSRLFIAPDETWVANNGGTVFRTSDLTYAGSLGEAFTDLAFTSEGAPVVLRNRSLIALSSVNRLETGRYALSLTGLRVFAQGNKLAVFAAAAAANSPFQVVHVAVSSLVPRTLPQVDLAAGERFSIDDIFYSGDGVVHVLSRSKRALIRWSVATRSYLSSLPLRGAPRIAEQNPGFSRAIMAYNDGQITETPLRAGFAAERQIGIIGNRPLAMTDMGDMVVLNVGQIGSSGDLRMLIGEQGLPLSLSTSSYWGYGLVWNPTLRRLYSPSRAQSDGIQYETVPISGVLPGTSSSSVSNFQAPLFPDSEFALLASANGRVVNADLSPVGTLANNILDAAWLPSGLFTLRAVSGQTQIQQWSRNTYLQSRTLTLTGTPLRIFRVSDTQLVVVSSVQGYLKFTLLNSDLTLVTPRDYTGTYFGQIGAGGTAGSFALHIRADQKGTLMLHLSGAKSALLATGFTVNNDGSLTVIARAVESGNNNTVSLSIAADGSVSGSVPGLGLTFVGTKATGVSGVAGFYQATAINGSTGSAYAIVGPGDRALIIVQNSATLDGGLGVIDSVGKLTATTATGLKLSGAINLDNGSLSATGDKDTFANVTFSGLRDDVARTDRLVNIASRGSVSASELMIAGFVITGTAPKPVMIRATGPALAPFGLTGTLTNPKLGLYRGNDKILENDDWSLSANSTDVAAAASRTGAFALAAGSLDAALVTTLSPGAYTAQVSSVTGATGVALVEVYDAGSSAVTADTPRLINISTRANVAGGEGLLIAGIVITGNSPKKILIRATGPALAAFGVPGALTDPLLKLYKGDAVLRQNDNWSDSAAEATLITAAGSATGAFALTPGTKDAALLITLEPGAYTAQVSGVAGAAGAALVEVYEVP